MHRAKKTSIDGPVQPANKLRAKRGPAFHESRSRIKGHNFAIRLLQTLESRIHLIVEDFCVGEGIRRQHSTLDRPTFIQTMLDHARAGPKDPDEMCWLASIPDAEMIEKLGEVFDAVDTAERGRVSFSGLMSYVIDCARYGEVGTVQEAIPEYIGTQGTFFRNLEDITRAKYCPELGRVLCSGKSIGIIQTQNFHIKSFPAYPHMMSASEKFASTYDMDYIPHMEAIAFVGTDLYIDFVSAENGANMMRISTPQTYSVCSYDRSTKLLLTARDDVVESYSLREFRTTDQTYSRGPVMKLHTGTIHCVRPLQRGGLLATASSDKTVVISDLEVNEVITIFRAHTHAVHSVEYIDHLNLMMSCGFDTEPKIWMLASSAMRSEAFTLRDVENPHTGVVVSACSVADTPQVCTLDSNGTVKLWDIRMFRAQQSIRLEKTMEGIFDAKSLKWHTILWDPSANELFACAQRRAQKLRRRVMLREEAPSPTGSPTKGSTSPPSSPSKKQKQQVSVAFSKTASMADESPIICVVYEPVSQTIVTLSEHKVRVWDLFTGHQEAIFDKLIPSESAATCLCVSSSGKVMFIGMRNGRLSAHQYSSGALLMTYVEEGPEIQALTYCTHAQAFCVVTWRGAKLYEDRHNQTTTFFPDSIRGAEVKGATFDVLTNILVTSERKGNISLWESRSGMFTPISMRNCGLISLGHLEVSCAVMLAGHSVLAVATHVGGVQLFTTTPHPVPNKKFAEGLFKGREVTSMQYYPPKGILYCGDDQGWIHAIDVVEALESVRCQRPCTSWPHLMSTAGRMGTAPQDIILLHTVHHVHAHMDSVGYLLWAVGCNTLISSSLDQRVVLWSLSLEPIGELDPLSEGGRFRTPMVAVPWHRDPLSADAPEHPFFVERAPNEAIPFSSANPELLPAESLTIGRGNNGALTGEGSGAEFSAASFAEDAHRIAAALESFVPSSPTTQTRDVVKELDELGIGESLVAKSYGRRASPLKKKLGKGSPFGSPRSRHSTTASSKGDEEIDPLVVYSSNSSGVACHSLFSTSPQRNAHKPKHVVVDAHTSVTGKGDDGEDGGASFTVTRNCPLPANARRDRDYLIRELQLRELAEGQPEKVNDVEATGLPTPLAIEPFARSTISPRGGSTSSHPVGTPTMEGRRPTSTSTSVQNNSFISQILPHDRHAGSFMSGDGGDRREVGFSDSFFGGVPGDQFEQLHFGGDGDASPEMNVQGAATEARSLAIAKMYRSLLPYELIQLKAELAKQEKRQNREKYLKAKAETPATVKNQKGGELRTNAQTPDPERRIIMPEIRRGGTRPASQLAFATRQNKSSNDDIDWASQTLPRGPGSVPPLSRSGGGAGTMTTTHNHQNSTGTTRPNTLSTIGLLTMTQPPPNHRRPFTRVGDVPSVGFCTFGVRSIAPLLMPFQEMKKSGWSKVHRVADDDDDEYRQHHRVGPGDAGGDAPPIPAILGMPGGVVSGDRPPRSTNSRPPTVPQSGISSLLDL
ncbi:WD40 repeat-containing protein, putative [Bodo saltans]|uniref:WD40 repeat-containing protein, putative n=1 Tax=Bodo saltans TaxID=75058 RepID=A0A0S4INE1_BODSA|nr:WD40 repeat-containing protein, putative [Bodo saltans]|eukprot:CUF65542.1 WD40 repeat-containing protein, putative [Bodo saltans]